MLDRARILAITLGLLLSLAAGPSSARGSREETESDERAKREIETAFVEGYATALLEQVQGVRDFELHFAASVLEVRFAEPPGVAVDKLARSLLEVRGVERVRILEAGELALDRSIAEEEDPATAQDAPNRGYDIFPGNELFRPLIADPRWPRFSGAYQSYRDDELDGVAAVSFGETFPLVRSPDLAWGEWEIAFQAGVFSVFDLDSASFDLVNSDFLAGLSASHHYGDFTTMARVFHQSSHLGDEFILSNPVDRVNLSFEVLDLIVSFDPWRWLRLYSGGGLLLHRDPNLDRGLLQSGLELTSPVAYIDGYLRPVAALDLQSREENDWLLDLSLRAGFQVEHPALEGRQLQILGELYDGRSPNGQFLERSIRTVGVGIFLGF